MFLRQLTETKPNRVHILRQNSLWCNSASRHKVTFVRVENGMLKERRKARELAMFSENAEFKKAICSPLAHDGFDSVAHCIGPSTTLNSLADSLFFVLTRSSFMTLPCAVHQRHSVWLDWLPCADVLRRLERRK